MIRKGKFDMALASVKVRSSGDVRFLDTVPATVDGALWYEVENGVPLLCLHKGNYDYCSTHDKIRLADNTNDVLVAYLPFDVSTTNDACGNIWTASGSPTIADGACSFNGSSYLVNETISAAIGDSPWTVDFGATPSDTTRDRFFFSTFNANYGTTGMVIKGWVHLNWYGGNIEYGSYGDNHILNLGLAPNMRHHFALVYDGTEKFVFVDGVLKGSYAENVELGGKFFIGRAPASDIDGMFAGTIDHFRIHDGVALWTENFTPPTATDYL